MKMSYEEATALVTGPGQPFEVSEIDVRGVPYRVFKNAPGTLPQVFAAARGYGDRTFLVYEEERWSFAEVMRQVDGLAAALADRFGIKRGDRVAIAMRNLPEWIVSFAAILSVGAISVSLNAWWSEAELSYGLEDSGASLLIADGPRVARSRSAAERLGISTIAVRSEQLEPGVTAWEDAFDPLDAEPPVVPIDPDDDATILYTSGTTADPKGAVSTHRAVTQALFAFSCAVVVARTREPKDDILGTAGSPAAGSPAAASAGTGPPPSDGNRADPAQAGPSEADGSPIDVPSGALPTFILVVPLFHVTGCIPVMLSSFFLGLKLVMMAKWDADKALELIEREQVTSFVGVPTQSWDLLESPRFGDFDTSSLRSVGGGGAPAPPTLVQRVEDGFSGGRPQIGYGMTETNAYGPGNMGDDYISHPTSTGRVVPIMQIEIRDASDHPVPTGERGEIWFKGPNLIRGYWRKPTETAETIVDGWLRTGDIGRIDDEGFVYVEDRAKDMVLRGGENVYSAEVEAAIYEHPSVYEAVVFGVPHERLGEEVVAVVHLKDGHTLTAEELQKHVAARLAAFKVPSTVHIVEERLPRNASGKVLKRELRSAFYG